MSRGIWRWLWGMRAWLWLESRIGFEIPLCFVLYVGLNGHSLRVPDTSSFQRSYLMTLSNAGFARGTDEGVRPYTCARLRLRWTAEGGCRHIFLPKKATGFTFVKPCWSLISRRSSGALGHHWRCGRLKRCVRQRMAWSYRATKQSHWTIEFGSRSWHRTVERAAPRRNQSSLLDGSDD